MYAIKSVTVGLLLVVAAAGCGSGSSTPPVAAAPTATSGTGGHSTPTSAAASSLTPADDHGVAWAKCMRGQGVDVADPTTQGKGTHLLLPKSADHTKADAAMKVCQKYLPDGGALVKPDPGVIAQERKMSQCMRENGVPKFPDPNADGALTLNGSSGLDPTDPTFLKAQNLCSQYAPVGPKGGNAIHPQSGK
jgi:hypothetical protein